MNQGSFSRKQLINAELAARAQNKRTKSILKEHMPKDEQQDALIAFNCECADPGCQERIEMSLEAYDKIHKNKAQFVLVKGHQAPTVEKTVAKTKNYAVVEKYAL